MTPSATEGTRTVVPFNDLSRALEVQSDELMAITRGVLASGWLIHGPEHQRFEESLALHVGANHALGVASGTDALELALRAAHRDMRRTVVTVANAGTYAATAALAAGFDVRFCDIDPSTHLMDPAALRLVLDTDVFAVVVTHLYGRVAEVGAIRKLCSEFGVAVVEDCAQAIGASGDEGPAGSLGDVAT